MRNFKIEEAIIVATYETDPKFPVETVVPEPVERPRRRRSGGLFADIFNLFWGDDFFDDFFSPQSTDYRESNTTPKKPEPELAVITDTNERSVEEIHFAYYEFID